MAQGNAVLYNSNFDVTIPFSDVSVQMALATNTNLAYTVPGNSQDRYSVRFMYLSTTNIFVCLNAAATVPGAGLKTTQPYLEFKPGYEGSQRYVKGGDTLNFMTPDASAYVGFTLRQLPG